MDFASVGKIAERVHQGLIKYTEALAVTLEILKTFGRYWITCLLRKLESHDISVIITFN